MPLTGATTVDRSRLSLATSSDALASSRLRLRDVDRLLALLDLLHRDGDAGQSMGAAQIAPGLIEIDLAAVDAGLGLIERILEAALIDLEQRLALGDLLIVVDEAPR